MEAFTKKIPVVNPRIVWREEEDMGLLHNLEGKMVYRIDLEGLRVLELCNGHNAVEEIANKLRQQFPNKSVIETEITDFLQKLEQKKIITWKVESATQT